jgi:hypothetical protein
MTLRLIPVTIDKDAPVAPKAPEGIFEEPDAAEGQLELKVRDPYGDRVALLQFRTGAVDDQLLIALEEWYSRRYVLSRRSDPPTLV